MAPTPLSTPPHSNPAENKTRSLFPFFLACENRVRSMSSLLSGVQLSLYRSFCYLIPRTPACHCRIRPTNQHNVA